jgi:hypothetical protein
MITIKEIADDDTKISSTRWAFASTIIFDMVVIALTLAAYVLCHIFGKSLDESLLYAVVTMLGVLTGITGTTKALQGFDTKGNDKG